MSYKLPCYIAVTSDLDMRKAAMTQLRNLFKSVPKGWSIQDYEGSITATSADRARIIKIDAYKVYTLDVRQSDGTYKSHRFNCKTIDEAWSMAHQIIRTYRAKHAAVH